MRALLDTCVLSELARRKPAGSVVAAVSEIPSENLFVSVLSIGEIASGVSSLADGKRKKELRSWLQTLERDYADRVLGVDLATAQIWGELTATARRAGKPIPAVDGLIAATARRHGLHVMTRNVGDFEGTGALVMNPWIED